jgi:hypothetical protein
VARAFVAKIHTFSMCFSSPLVKFNISSAFLIKTVPLVSVCAMSIGFVKTATFAFVTFFTSPDQGGMSVRSAADAKLLRTFRFPTKHHTLYYFASCQAASHDFDHSNIIDVERLVVFWHD